MFKNVIEFINYICFSHSPSKYTFEMGKRVNKALHKKLDDEKRAYKMIKKCTYSEAQLGEFFTLSKKRQIRNLIGIPPLVAFRLRNSKNDHVYKGIYFYDHNFDLWVKLPSKELPKKSSLSIALILSDRDYADPDILSFVERAEAEKAIDDFQNGKYIC